MVSYRPAHPEPVEGHERVGPLRLRRLFGQMLGNMVYNHQTRNTPKDAYGYSGWSTDAKGAYRLVEGPSIGPGLAAPAVHSVVQHSVHGLR